ncbi:hypothetical protein C8R43DRAFT_901315 [Mycena crocata]|nr:hypothetical protein C8R43DRAFT_901315 [Mycena crocata]
MNFEAACGYEDAGVNVPTTERPSAIRWWLARGRGWNKKVDIGELGKFGLEESYIDRWWKWWATMQPEGRILKADGKATPGGMLTAPTVCDWGSLAGLHGKNSMMQVMASLLWWGERVEEHPLDAIEWASAVDEVSYVLGEVTAAIKRR